ncbi:PREDICTED: one cut domain family member 3 [Hipposideros armiger]|uniref:One cut domain family member 3 n=1 Tax=Hipposideros armiger TaxID=186990 RepID=A0A8B7SL72_HIPAR|nr:PREDICTED: one cut domain family member 3 [Hipposideros armiger]
MELSLESLGGLHGVAHAQAGELLSPGHARSAAAQHRGLVAPGRPGLVAGMASLLDGGGGAGGAGSGADFRGELAGPLHPTMGMACEAPGLGGTYTTLTPLQHLPPLAAVADKFHPHAAAAGAHGGHPHTHPHPAPAPPPPPPPQRLAASVSGSFTLMRDERAALASVGHLYGPYGKELPAMGSPLSPLPNALPPALHGAPQPPPPLAAYGAPGHLAGDKLLPPAAFEPHAALLGRAEDALARGLPGGGSGGACKRKEQEQQKERALQPKKQRLVFTDLQRRTLIAIFKENKRPSKEMQVTISQQLGLELNTVSNFFMNARRRCMNRWSEEPGAAPGGPAGTATFSKA